MKVYVIMGGRYSDKQVLCATLDKEEAEWLADFYSSKADDVRVEKFDTDTNPQRRKLYYKWWFLLSCSNGETKEIHEKKTAYDLEEDRYDHVVIIKRNRERGIDWYEVTVPEDDHDVALKIAYDKLAEFRAKEEGIA